MVMHIISAGFCATKFDEASAQMVNLLHVGYGPKLFGQSKMCSENMNVQGFVKNVGVFKDIHSLQLLWNFKCLWIMR